MREYNIAYGSHVSTRHWLNQKITWEGLREKLRNTLRTSETVEEYQRMKGREKDQAKDHGGFVAGYLRDSLRKKENIASRSMLTMDADHLKPGFLDSYEMLTEYRTFVYTTHGHTPKAPRARLIIPFSRDVTADEYEALARYFAADWGIDQFDECSYKINQLMFWPTTPSDGEYIFREIEGEELDPDRFLSAHPSWRDCSLLPISSRESSVTKTEIQKQADPLRKRGIVGAFCRIYPVSGAIRKYLSDVYEPSTIEGRYQYIPADSIAGVQVYEDKFAYSHHASDPACGHLYNAFDLVRVHRFGKLEEKESFAAMAELAAEDEKVKALLVEEKVKEAKDDFEQIESEEKVEDDSDDWHAKLDIAPRSGKIRNSTWNEMLILKNDPDFQNFAYNRFAGRVQVTGPLPWERPTDNPFWRDVDTAHLLLILDRRYTPFSRQNHEMVFANVADDRAFHPICDYLDSLPPWDGVKRVERILIDGLDAEDTEYVRAVTRKTFTAAVARVYQPGIKFDSVLVLDGEQGIGKSTLYRELVGDEYFSDTLQLTDMQDKSGAEKLQGCWLVEIAELAGMKKADIEKVKAFLSTSDDKYRPSYGRTVESHKRQCVIVASVNGERGYLRDITGNRRFWVVKLRQTEQRKRYTITDDFRDKFWAECKYYYEHGEKLYLEGSLIREAEKVQHSAMELDERRGSVEEYLNMLLPDSWAKMDTYTRRQYFACKDDPTSPRGTHRREMVSNVEIWAECFGRNVADLKPADSYAIAAIMTQIPGWERTKKAKRIPWYGQQRQYRRIKEEENG